jgi:prepilin-type N-terminal cleavage/methylation domain-containing protein
VQEMKRNSNIRRGNEKGFSLLEMIIASAILLVGVLSVVQLVPASLKSNLYNRMDTMATVVAQHQLDLMINQPLSTNNFQDPPPPATVANTINLGGTAGWSGSRVVMQGSTPIIDFTQNPAVDGYNIQGYQDANDPNFPNGPQFELRWAVFTVVSNGVVVSKRIIIGCRQTNAAQPMLPITLDTSVQR